MPGLEFRDRTWIFGQLNNTEIAGAICGAIGSPVFGGLFCVRLKYRRKADSEHKPWQFSMRDLFVHFTVLAVLISLWTWFFTHLREVDHQKQSAPARQTGKP
jgi:heme/copper-type cytochrome/quinol oxidase subunit 2